MLPNIHMHEQFIHSRIQERLDEAKQERMLAHLRKPRHSILQHIIKSFSLLFM